MEIAYWILAALLAIFYLYAGGKKVAQSREQLEPMMGWVDQVPMPIGGIATHLEPGGLIRG